MRVTVNPLNKFSVTSTTQFVGASEELPLINYAANVANTAIVIANSTAANSLPISGGEITGNLKVDGLIYGNIAIISAGTY